jgi:hypothetical protein
MSEDFCSFKKNKIFNTINQLKKKNRNQRAPKEAAEGPISYKLI